MIKYAGILSLALVASAAQAETVHESWKSYSNDGRCHAVSVPTSSEGSIDGRGPAYVAIQNHPSEDIRGSIAIVSGSDATGLGTVDVTVDGKGFEVLPFKDSAFAASGKPEAALVAAMRRGHELKVEWTLQDGKKVTDRYDLKGFTAAKNAIDSECR